MQTQKCLTFRADNHFFVKNFLVQKWPNYLDRCLESFLRSQYGIDIDISFLRRRIENYNESYFYSHIWGQSRTCNENRNSSLRTGTNGIDLTMSNNENDLKANDLSKSTNDLGGFQKSVFDKYKHLWVQCEICYGLNYKKFFKSKMYICEECGYHLKMSSSDRIELLIDPGTWNPKDEDMLSLDPIEFDSKEDFWDSDEEEEKEEKKTEDFWDPDKEEEEYVWDPNEEESDPRDPYPQEDPWDSYSDLEEEDPGDPDPNKDLKEEDPGDPDPEEEDEDEPYKDRINSYQKKTGLIEAVQTGIAQLSGIPAAIGVMDFQFMGGSMGSVVGEKITRLIEYAANRCLPLILVCASGGARMQEGSLSLMQMAKISSALYDYQRNKKLFYVSILTSPTTGGVTASFGMLGDIIIAEPEAYIAFAGKRVIEQTLNVIVPEGSQEAEFLFGKGLFDLIVPRNPLKNILNELLQFHAFFPLNHNSSIDLS